MHSRDERLFQLSEITNSISSYLNQLFRRACFMSLKLLVFVQLKTCRWRKNATQRFVVSLKSFQCQEVKMFFYVSESAVTFKRQARLEDHSLATRKKKKKTRKKSLALMKQFHEHWKALSLRLNTKFLPPAAACFVWLNDCERAGSQLNEMISCKREQH